MGGDTHMVLYMAFEQQCIDLPPDVSYYVYSHMSKKNVTWCDHTRSKRKRDMYMTYGQCNEIYTLQDSKVAYKTRTLTLRLTSSLKASANPKINPSY